MPNYSHIDLPRSVAGTIVLCTLIAVALTLFGSHGGGFGTNLVYSLCIGLLTYATIDFPRRRMWPRGAPALLLLCAQPRAARPTRAP